MAALLIIQANVERRDAYKAYQAAVEFPSMAAIRSFWGSPEYAKVKKLRQGAATVDVWAVPGA